MQISFKGYGVTFLRLSQAAPQVSADGVVNAASYAGGGVSPGEIVAVFGKALGPAILADSQTSSPGVFDDFLAGTRVWFDGIAAPLVYTSAVQLAAIVPYEVAGETGTNMQVEYLGALSSPLTIPVVASLPGLFTDNESGTGQGAIFNTDGTLNSASNPAAIGRTVTLLVTGEGQTSPVGADGKIATTVLPKPTLPVSAQIGGINASVTYAGAAAGMVAGSIQIIVQVPFLVTPGSAVPVIVTIGAATSQPGVTMAVQ
jgi:uncharacterized protein (TIGR03437 family)